MAKWLQIQRGFTDKIIQRAPISLGIGGLGLGLCIAPQLNLIFSSGKMAKFISIKFHLDQKTGEL